VLSPGLRLRQDRRPTLRTVLFELLVGGAEPGCLWFDWSRSLDDPQEYVLVEAFADDVAAAAHVQSEHFKGAQRDLPPHLEATPRIVNFTIPGTDWSELGELAVAG
jgi:quinol monooxygenase YgiN